MSRILVTGAAGFIGSQLAHRLYGMGEDVTLLDDFSYGSEDNLIFPDHDFRNEIVRASVTDRCAMDRLFSEKQFEIVYHFAGITPLPDCQNRPSDALSVNVGGTVLLLSLARSYGVRRFLFASTSAVYENTMTFPSVEDTVVPPGLIYPSTKYAAEQFCRSFASCYGMNVVCFRFANVYGPHIDCLRTQPPVMGYLIREFFRGRSPVLHASGEQKRDYIYVDDLLDLVILAQKTDGFDVLNVGTEKTVSVNEIASLIAEKMGCSDIPVEHAQVAHFWHNYPELYEGPLPIREEVLAHEVLKYTCLSTKHAHETLGWTPKTPLSEGLDRTIEFSLRVLQERDREADPARRTPWTN